MDKLNDDIKKEIQAAVKETVNGKIDRVRDEQIVAHEKLHGEIDELKESIKEVLDAFQDTSGFFKTIVKIAKLIMIIGGAVAIIWSSVIKFR